MSLSSKFSSSGGGGGSTFSLIETQTASNSANVDFTGFSATYDFYRIYIYNAVPVTDSATLLMLTSTDGGSSFDTGATDYSFENNLFASGDRDDMPFSGLIGNLSTEGVQGYIDIFDPLTVNFTKAQCHTSYFSPTPTLGFRITSAQRNAAQSVDAVRILFDTGNISTGTFKLYGWSAS